tara:strand:+ start:4054 stop:4713 length:660 start_codon:yes stop_codon:yes gene_type:complete
MFKGIIEPWKSFFSRKNNILVFILTVLFSISYRSFFKEYLLLVESWEHNLGIFNDPFFLEDPLDLSIPIFIFTYGTILFFIIYHLKNPTKLMYLMQLAVMVDIFRVISLYFVRLDAPEMISLNDPILNFLIYEPHPETDLYNQHDLFFSGHTANLFIISYLYEKNYLRYFFFLITFCVATFLVLQKVHYSIDVIFAPIISILILYIHKKIFIYLSSPNE